MKKLLILGCAAIGLMACQQDPSTQVLTLTAESKAFNIVVPAKGELKSASEVVISTPGRVRGSLTLSWLKEENSLVEKGEVVARFDGEEKQILLEQAQMEFDKILLSKQNTEQTLSLDQFSISQQAELIGEEIALTDRFSSEDLSIYSKNEVIDQLLNKEYLTAKDAYLTWSKDSKTEQSTAQIELLALQGKTHTQTINMHDTALKQLEVIAPQSGIFVHDKNWRGEKVRAGASMWPGSKIASIPSLDKMQAKMFILETEAGGIAAGQKVELYLDAYPNRKLGGVVNKIATIAAPKLPNNPVKYFEVIVDLDKSEPEFMKPGQKLTANIIVHSENNAITVPNQVIYQQDGKQWVYVKRGSSFEKQQVTIGKRSNTQSSLVSGVEEGDEIALVQPEEVRS